ncbi:hypothetical protein [Micromonospora sonneratiae]|uniref:Uncharacterized protein n=1 Tax=Micromonospora sonneratiae TaxID=1184706 RepID=A0ABW3YP89_9ACTN
MSTQAPSRQQQTQQRPDWELSERQDRDMRDMPTRPMPAQGMAPRPADHVHPSPAPGTETKSSLKSTELWIYLAAVAGVLIASQVVGRNSTGVDIFRADNAWFMITLLTIGYLVSRGLAKAGSAWRGSADRR